VHPAPTEYELFISYARLDNRPDGWVAALRDALVADQRRYSTEPLRIFFDTDEIKDMDDWRHRILGGLRSSRVLLVCLSPSYLRSQPCRWEWDEYRARQTHRQLGSESVANVYLVEVPAGDDRLEELLRVNFTDLRQDFAAGPGRLSDPAVRQRLEALGLSLWERIERARRARDVPGNVRRVTPYFVGRSAELRQLHEQLGVGAIGVVTAVHGLGGQGKTELAVAYANGYAYHYSGGLWSLPAEGRKELLPLLADLAFVPAFGYTPTDAERTDATRLGQAVLRHLQARGGPALVLLDNVSEPDLLGPAQLATLPREADWLRLVATTRLGPERLAKSAKQLATVAVDSLTEADALALVREHQPGQAFPSAAEEAAAREIVRELGGFTLAVEQVAIYLGLNVEHEPPSAFLARLRSAGLPSVDDLPADADVATQMLHQQKQLGPILSATLAGLEAELPAARTALQLASLLPPDSVPWPWLHELTTQRHPDLADRPAEWARLRRRLEGLRLLTGGDQPEVARMHRLVAAHLRRQTDMEKAEEVVRFVGHRADVVYREQGAPAEWELDGLVAAVPHLLARHPSSDLASDGTFLVEKVLRYRPLPIAQALLTATHSVSQRLAAADPANADWQRDLSASLEKLGGLAVARGDLTEAERYYTDCHQTLDRLASSDRGNAAWQHDLSVSLEKLGELAVARGDLAEAQHLFAECLAIHQTLAAADWNNPAWQRDLSVSQERLGNLAVARGDLAEAQRLFAECLAIRQRLAAADPANAQCQRDLSVSLNKLGDLAIARGDLAEAKLLFAESLEIAQRRTMADPDNTAWQGDLAVSLSKLGELAVARGDLAEAHHLYAECLAIRQRLVAADRDNAGWQRALSVSLNKLGELAVARGDLAEAHHLFAECLVTRQRLAAADPANAQWQRDLSVSLEKLGELAVARSDLAEAQRLFAECLAIRQRLAAADPANAGWQRDLSVSLERLGELAVARGDLAEAHHLFAECLVTRQRLAAADPANAQWQRDLWVAHGQLANLLENQGDSTATDHWLRAHDLLAGMIQTGLHVSVQDLDFLDQLRRMLGH